MRPWRDSETTVQIAWYPAAKGAAHLPYPSAFMSRDWDADFPELTGPGEVYGASRNYNGRGVNPNATGQHICGTADQWAGRAEYDPTANVQYNRDGIPLCCGAAELPRGGVLLGGRAAVGYTPPAAPITACCTGQPLPNTLTLRRISYAGITPTPPVLEDETVTVVWNPDEPLPAVGVIGCWYGVGASGYRYWIGCRGANGVWFFYGVYPGNFLDFGAEQNADPDTGAPGSYCEYLNLSFRAGGFVTPLRTVAVTGPVP